LRIILRAPAHRIAKHPTKRTISSSRHLLKMSNPPAAPAASVPPRVAATLERAWAAGKDNIAADHPSVTPEELQAILDRHDAWAAADEQALAASWQTDPLRAAIHRLPRNGNNELHAVLRLVVRFFRCRPIDILSPKYFLTYDDSTHVHKVVRRDGKTPANPLWTAAFARAFGRILINPLWKSPQHKMDLLTQVLQFAVLCRTNDCRVWPFVHWTNSLFLEMLQHELHYRQPGTILPVIIDRIGHQLAGRIEDSWALLFRSISRTLFKVANPLITTGDIASAPLAVTVADLLAIETAINELPTLDGPKLATTNIWSAMTSERKGRDAPVGHQPFLDALNACGKECLRRYEQAIKSPPPVAPSPPPPSPLLPPRQPSAVPVAAPVAAPVAGPMERLQQAAQELVDEGSFALPLRPLPLAESHSEPAGLVALDMQLAADADELDIALKLNGYIDWYI
jgi:hypothetical protein